MRRGVGWPPPRPAIRDRPPPARPTSADSSTAAPTGSRPTAPFAPRSWAGVPYRPGPPPPTHPPLRRPAQGQRRPSLTAGGRAFRTVPRHRLLETFFHRPVDAADFATVHHDPAGS